jgi:hypothetical protein
MIHQPHVVFANKNPGAPVDLSTSVEDSRVHKPVGFVRAIFAKPRMGRKMVAQRFRECPALWQQGLT